MIFGILRTEPLFLGIVSFILSAFLLKVLLPTNLANYFTDKPDFRKVHFNPISRLGGVVIITSFISVVVLWRLISAVSEYPQLQPELFAAIIVSAICLGIFGVLDDTIFFDIRVRHKIVVEIILAAVIVEFFNIYIQPQDLTTLITIPVWFSKVISVLWIIGVINAFNLIDGLDGLAGSLAVIAFFALAIIAGVSHHPRMLAVCIIMAGTILGFLIHNISPAKVFMGDTGSLFTGAMLGVLTLYLSKIEVGSKSVFVMPLILGIPICEVFITIVRRYFRARDQKKSLIMRLRLLGSADNSHIHHRMLFRGYSHTQAMILADVLAALLAFGALCIYLAPSRYALFFVLYLVFPLMAKLYRLGFGGRFLKKLGINKTQYNGFEKTMLVGIYKGMDPKLYSDLTKKKQKGIAFVPFGSEQDIQLIAGRLSAVVVIDSEQKSREIEDSETELAIHHKLKGPVYYVSPAQDSKLFIRKIKVNGKISLEDKIITMPQFLKKLSLANTERIGKYVDGDYVLYKTPETESPRNPA